MPETKQYNLKNMRYALLCAAAILLTMLALTPQLQAQALYLITDGEKDTVLDGMTTVSSDRIIVTGARNADPEVTLRAGEKVTVLHSDTEEYATTRSNETVKALIERLKITMTPIEMAVVDISGEEITVEIVSDFTYYETATEAVAHTTIYTPAYDRPKGEIEVTQPGVDGMRDVVYEVVYADGELVSRQVVDESNNTSVPELANRGTLVTQVQPGDTVSWVEYNEDGSGYLVMKSGDSLHYTSTMNVTCTAYTAGAGRVDAVTATGSVARIGTVAVDKRVIPLGTKMYVIGSSGYDYGMAVAEDTGVKGEAVDLYMNTRQECLSFGRQKNSTVYFLE